MTQQNLPTAKTGSGYERIARIPTVAGEVVFDPAYEGNPIVNAMCVGLLKEEELMRAVAEGVGNPIIAVGARTGRDSQRLIACELSTGPADGGLLRDESLCVEPG